MTFASSSPSPILELQRTFTNKCDRYEASRTRRIICGCLRVFVGRWQLKESGERSSKIRQLKGSEDEVITPQDLCSTKVGPRAQGELFLAGPGDLKKGLPVEFGESLDEFGSAGDV